MKRLIPVLAIALVVCLAASAQAWPRARVIRTPFRPRVGAIIVPHSQQFFVQPQSIIIAPQGFYGPAIVPPQTIIIR